MNDVQKILLNLHIIIKQQFNYENLYFLLNNKCSLFNYYEIPLNYVELNHNLNFLEINKIIVELEKEYNLKKIFNKLNVDSIIIKKYNITIKFVKYSCNNENNNNIFFNNFYYDILNLKYIYYKNNYITDCEEFYLEFNKNKIELKNNLLNIIKLIYFLIISDYNYIILYLEKYLNRLSLLEITTIRNNFKQDGVTIYKNFIEIIIQLNEGNKLEEWINLLNHKFQIINSILFRVDRINIYNINMISKEVYLLLILVKTYNLINTNINSNQTCMVYNELLSFFEIDKLNMYKELKLLNQNLPNFDNLLIGMSIHSKIKIKEYYHILQILFYNLNNSLLSLKLAYIYKKYYKMEIKELEDLFKIYQNIILEKNYNDIEIPDQYFFKILENNKIKEFENIKLQQIPNIKKNYILKNDNIDIIDFQDSFGLVYAYLYENKINLEIPNIEEYLDTLQISILANIRSNKLINNSVKKISFNDLNDSNINEDLKINENFEEYKINENFEDFLNQTNFINNVTKNIDIKTINNSNLINNHSINDYKDLYKQEKLKYNKLKIIDKMLLTTNLNYKLFINFNELDDKIINYLIKELNNKNEITKYSIIEDNDDFDSILY